MKKEELKVGDKVLLKNRRGEKWNDCGRMDHYMGKIVTIRSLGDNYFTIEEDDRKGGYWSFYYDDIERKANKAKREDLQFADILTLRNGERYVVADYCIYGEDGDYSYGGDDIQIWYNDDLTQNEGDADEDIVKVERAGQVIYERIDEVKEMTIEEISKALGYEVKIVKEKINE